MVRGGRRIGSALALLSLLGCCGAVPPPAPNLGRRSRWALLGVLSLLAGVVLLPSAPAQAQAVNVNNFSQTAGTDESTSSSTPTKAVAFTTGGNTFNRYTLNSVTIRVTGNNNGSFQVGIYNPGSGSNSSNPGTQIGNNLTKVGTATTGNITFNASSITLKGGTTYFVQVTGTAAAGNPAFNLGKTWEMPKCGHSRVQEPSCHKASQ